MKAIVVHRPGGPEVLEYEDVPDPAPGPGEVLIRNLASGINFSDTGRRRNAREADLPLMLGSEAAGPIIATGEGVTEFHAGDYVACQGPDYVSNATGAYAELVVCRLGRVVKVPADVRPEVAVAVMLQALTAYALAFGAYQVKEGDRVLIQAGAGGVGLMLTQMAKQAGAHVYSTVGDDSKIADAKEAGADEVINYSKDDFEAYVLTATNGQGVNAVFDAVGRATFMKGIACLAPLGMMISYGSASGPVEPFTLGQLGGKGVYVTNANMRHHLSTPELWSKCASELLEWTRQGKLKTWVTTYPLAKASEAHRDLEERKSKGKLVLIP